MSLPVLAGPPLQPGVPLAVVAVDQLTRGEERFACARYRSKPTAAQCVGQQILAGVDTARLERSTGAANLRRLVHSVEGCGGCAQGASVVAVLPAAVVTAAQADMRAKIAALKTRKAPQPERAVHRERGAEVDAAE